MTYNTLAQGVNSNSHETPQGLCRDVERKVLREEDLQEVR
jgi:hypothetical protein